MLPSVLVKLNAPAVAVLHTVELDGTVTIGDGATLTVNDCAAPVQPAAVGVTDITAVAVTVEVLMAVNAAMVEPDPDAANPIDGLELVHVMVVPVTALLKLYAPAVVLLHTVALAGTTATGVGDTLTVKSCTAPGQVAAVGVTVNTPVVVVVPPLVAVNEAKEAPAPDAPMPIVVLLLAHV